MSGSRSPAHELTVDSSAGTHNHFLGSGGSVRGERQAGGGGGGCAAVVGTDDGNGEGACGGQVVPTCG